MARLTLLTLLTFIGGCVHGLTGVPPLHPDAPRLTRADFNRLADQLGVPLHWQHDEGARAHQLDPDELVAQAPLIDLDAYVREGMTTSAFQRVMARIVDARRREAVRQELDQGRATVVLSELDGLRDDEITFLGHIRRAARAISKLYEAQRGTLTMRAGLYADDPASQALFARNQGPWCEAPRTRRDPFCHALPTWAPRRVAVYPHDITPDTAWCERLDASEDQALRDPFTAVIKGPNRLEAIAYTEAFEGPMREVSDALADAADALDPQREGGLVAYLRVTADAFLTNDWARADEAWAAMAPGPSRWYLRVGPDETDWEPCYLKAGFHLMLGRIDPPATTWSHVLEGLRDEMEDAVARVVGPPYMPRPVDFRMPEYVKVLLTEGKSRLPLGAVLGLTLPRVGPVADRGDQRAIAMVYVGTDPETLNTEVEKARALLDPPSEAHLTLDPGAARLSRVLHEAARRLGPRPDPHHLPGPTGATLRGVWSHAAASLLLDVLAERGLLSKDQVHEGWAYNTMEAFDLVARHLIDGADTANLHGAAAAIFLGWLGEQGALSFVGASDTGRAGDFHLNVAQMGPAIRSLVQGLGQIFAEGDGARGGALIRRLMGDEALAALHPALIAERTRSFPKASYTHVLSARGSP